MSDDEDDFRPSFGGLGSGGLGGGLGFHRATTTNDDDDEDEEDEGEDNGQPSFARSGGLGFRPPTSFMQSATPDLESDRADEHEDAPPQKKMRFSSFQEPSNSTAFGQGAGSKYGEREGAAAARGGGSMKAGSSFAQRMMARMGYKEGEGLGKDGRGRLAEISAQLRPQGAGLGAVKEKTQQAKDEERRAAALRGEAVDEDSEEEERRRKKEARRRRHEQGLTGMGAPGGRKQGQQKTRYRTAAEIEVESDGLQVPNALKTIIDVTGKETTYMAPSSGQGAMVAQETEAVKIARRAKRDLEAFAEEWANAKEQMTYLDMENEQIVAELDKQQGDDAHVKAVVEAVEGLQELSIGPTDGGVIEATDDRWEALTKKLEAIEVNFRNDLNRFGIQEAAVAAVQPLFKISMLNWEPLEKPYYLVNYLTRLQHVLGADALHSTSDAVVQKDDESNHNHRPSKRSTTHYESLLYTLWLPQVRSAITNNWNVQEPGSVDALLTAWKPLLPEFIVNNLTNQLIIPRLLTTLSAWKPGRKSKVSSPPHQWLFPWLQHLPPSHLDPQAHAGLAVELKRKVRSLLSHHDVRNGAPDWLLPLHSPLMPQPIMTKLLTNTLLPRLSAYFYESFSIDPANQDIEPLEHVLSYQSLYSGAAFAELLVAGFFTHFHAVLYVWLTVQPDASEIRQWFLWWKEEMIPPALSKQQSIDIQWTAALEMIDKALKLGDDARAKLPPIEAFLPDPEPDRRDERNGRGDRHRRHHDERRGRDERNRHRRRRSPEEKRTPSHHHHRHHDVQEEVTFRDIVEEFAAENGLLFMAMREAHPTNGAPLLRITANANGKGGVVGYVKGDNFHVRKKILGEDGVEKTTWKPVMLEEVVKLAGG